MWAESVACVREMGNEYTVLVGNLKGRFQSNDQTVLE